MSAPAKLQLAAPIPVAEAEPAAPLTAPVAAAPPGAEGEEEGVSSDSTLRWMSWENSQFLRAPSVKAFQWTIVSLTALTGLCLVLAAFVSLDIGVESMGEIVSESELRDLYALTDGYVSDVERALGDKVEKDAIIAHIRTGDASESELRAAERQLAQSIAAIQGAKEQIDPIPPLPLLRESDPVLSPRFAALEQAHRNLQEQRRLLAAGLAKELAPLVEREKSLKSSLKRLQGSSRKRLMSYYVEGVQDDIRRLSAQVATTQAQYDTKSSQALSEFLRELTLTQGALHEFIEAHLIRSPIRGRIVKQSLVPNSHVTAKTRVSSVIPEGSGWIAKVRVRPQDVVWLKVGQPILYKMESYPFERYGLFEGSVLSVDPVRDDDSRPEAGFVIKGTIRAPATLSDERKKDIKMVMGLNLNAKIITGRETILNIVTDHLYPSQRGR